MRAWHEFWPLVLSVSFLAGVAGNLVASAILGTPALAHLHRKLNRQHAERMKQAERHHRELLDRIGGGGQHAERMKQAERHHRELLDRIGAEGQ